MHEDAFDVDAEHTLQPLRPTHRPMSFGRRRRLAFAGVLDVQKVAKARLR